MRANSLRVTFLLAALLGPLAVAAQSASSSQVARPGNSTPSYGISDPGVLNADSRNAATVTNWTPVTATVGRPGAGCALGWVWGAPYGVSNCLRPVDKCEAAYLTWISGNAICQGFAPATAAFFYVPKRYYQGNLVVRCPEGASRASCSESYEREDSPPISVMTVPAISNSTGSAAAICRGGNWAIASSNCSLPAWHQ